jgi:carbonic anhydrase
MFFYSHRKTSLARFLLCATVLSVLATVSNAQQSKPEWSYTGENSPAKWGELDAAYTTCSVGKRQSPMEVCFGTSVKDFTSE